MEEDVEEVLSTQRQLGPEEDQNHISESPLGGLDQEDDQGNFLDDDYIPQAVSEVGDHPAYYKNNRILSGLDSDDNEILLSNAGDETPTPSRPASRSVRFEDGPPVISSPRQSSSKTSPSPRCPSHANSILKKAPHLASEGPRKHPFLYHPIFVHPSTLVGQLGPNHVPSFHNASTPSPKEEEVEEDRFVQMGSLW